eukprot:Nitzschia sp. Nitz4//scaffold72_size95085//37697//38716//NITZ4_004754-RA/size95085-processed-gene-0.21-mRNA-1//-1//CDS//3329557357//4121//frame0
METQTPIENTRGEKRPLSFTSHGPTNKVKRVSFTPSHRTKLEAPPEAEEEDSSSSRQEFKNKLKALNDANELAKKRFASRESSRRTRERERHKVDHFQNNKARLEKENERFREENERLRILIETIKKSNAGATGGTKATAGGVNQVSPTPGSAPQMAVPPTNPATSSTTTTTNLPLSTLSHLLVAAASARNNGTRQGGMPNYLQPQQVAVLQQIVLQILSNALLPAGSQLTTSATSTNALQSQLVLSIVAQCGLLGAGGTQSNSTHQTVPSVPNPANQPTNWMLPPPMVSPAPQQPASAVLSSLSQEEQPQNLLQQTILLLRQQEGNQLSHKNVGNMTS